MRVLSDVLLICALALFGVNATLVDVAPAKACATGGNCVKSGSGCLDDNCNVSCPGRKPCTCP